MCRRNKSSKPVFERVLCSGSLLPELENQIMKHISLLVSAIGMTILFGFFAPAHSGETKHFQVALDPGTFHSACAKSSGCQCTDSSHCSYDNSGANIHATITCNRNVCIAQGTSPAKPGPKKNALTNLLMGN